MTTPPVPPKPRRPLIGIAVACFLAGLVVSGFFIYLLVSNLPSVPTRLGDSPVRLERAGLTVFASQPALSVTCKATDESGADIPLRKPDRSEQYALETKTFYVVAHSVDKVPPQSVQVRCPDSDVAFYVGQRHTMGTFMIPALGAVGSFGLFLVIGVVLIVLDRRQTRR
ncbi:hypothetical protein [Kribbella amoyensis]|uniref:hypothetical protein n=1 Tax=Kribbella amoyensis TaxID=996641 RepID=UPI0011A985D1|nr:hypothetical protein [Kribbella amoyensis]